MRFTALKSTTSGRPAVAAFADRQAASVSFTQYSNEAAFEFQRYLFQPVEQRDSKHCFFQSGVAANTREDFGRALLLDRPGLNDPKFLHPELYGRPVHP